jgi:aryl-alcohol dehydrogenase-like predicted oxidoreductase
MGAEVSIYGLGLGSAFSKPFTDKPEDAQALLERALELGINYWDTARGYGKSEELIGPVVENHRKDIFLVSKSGEKTYDEFMRELETGPKKPSH